MIIVGLGYLLASYVRAISAEARRLSCRILAPDGRDLLEGRYLPPPKEYKPWRAIWRGVLAPGGRDSRPTPSWGYWEQAGPHLSPGGVDLTDVNATLAVRCPERQEEPVAVEPHGALCHGGVHLSDVESTIRVRCPWRAAELADAV